MCGIDTSADLKTIRARVEHQGMSFLTITLSDFRVHFELSLGAGSWQPGLSSFHKRGGLPVFLRGYLLQVFNDDGSILDEPSTTAIQAIRQITGLANKVLLPTTERRNQAAIDGFIKCEMDLSSWEDNVLPTIDFAAFDRIVSVLFGQMFSNLDLRVWQGGLKEGVERLLPKHGPGATADKLRGNKKYMQQIWYHRLEEYFPCGEYLFPNWGWYQSVQDVEFHEPGAELPVKVTLVPKTLKTPRIIAIEPTAFQYCQQAILEAIELEVAEDPRLKQMLSWKSQVPNQDMAHLGSIDGSLATLDLSEASDRVSNQLVLRMLKNFPHLRGAVQACRSTVAKLPGKKGLVPLRKFASMGSALCFPFESMLFLTLAVMGTLEANRTDVSRKTIMALSSSVRTYGDDIVCPSVSAETVINCLEGFALKVNRRKSFWTGKFRESCGKEYFDGADVGFVKLRREFPANRHDAEGVASLVALRNLLWLRGYLTSAEWLDDEIRTLIPFPRVRQDTGALCALDYVHDVEKIDVDLQKPLVKAMRVHAKIPNSKLGEHGALMKHFLRRGEEPFQDLDHLLRSGRPVSLSLKKRWVPVH